MTDLTKQVTDLQVKKCDKKELTMSQSKMQTMISSASSQDFNTKLVTMNGELVQKISDLRSDIVKRFSDIHGAFNEQILHKVSVQDLHTYLDEKADMSQVRQLLIGKVTSDDLVSLR